MTSKDPPSQTTMGRIAALEARYAELLARLDKFQREVLDAVSGDPPKRDPASTTNARIERAWQPHQAAPASARAFGFGKETA